MLMVHSTALLRFAIACDLNRISDPRQHMSSYSGLLGQPADVYAVAERINMWWSCYVLAHQLSTITGLPNDLPAGSHVVCPFQSVSTSRFTIKFSAGHDSLSSVIPGSRNGILSLITSKNKC